MSELLESVHNEQTKPEPPKETEKVKIHFSVFFDGTLNNRTNIDRRLVSANDQDLTDEERRDAKELKQKMSLEELRKSKGIYKKRQGVASYENGYTNIVKMEKYFDDTSSDPKLLIDSLYLEGPGSMDNKGDSPLGYGLGVWRSGVKAKVKAGIKKSLLKIKGRVPNKNVIIESISVNVFGFSRGAAAARHFIHRAIDNESSSIKKQLEDKGYQVLNVKTVFAGLYDTVSSHGLSFSNDTKALNLDATKNAEEVVHLAAANEHRENFSLTKINRAGGKGIQIYLPGVHSDIGGSYRDMAREEQDIYWALEPTEEAAKNKGNAEIARLKTEGWYHKDELSLRLSSLPNYDFYEVNVHAERNAISNKYSRIPLHVMTDFARNNNVPIKNKLERVEKIPKELGKVKSNLFDYVGKHKGKGAYSSKPEDWLDNDRQWLCKLRHDYFHFSARLEFGNGPRYRNGERWRMEYDG